MRILYTSASSDIRNNQRFETHFIEVAKNLVEIGNDLLVLVTGYAPRDETNYDLNIKFIPSGRRRFLSYLWAEILRTFYLPYLIWKWKPGVIYTRRDRFEIFPPIWARLLKVPYVTEIHGIIEQESQIQKDSRWFSRLSNLAERLSCTLATRVVCVTYGIKRVLIRKYHLGEAKLVVIPNGANTDLFSPLNKMECRRKLGLEEKVFYVGFAGSFYPWQGLKTLIEAARLIKEQIGPEIKFILVGDGAEESLLTNQVEQYGLGNLVKFIGRITYENVPSYINAFDICYLSRENYPGVFSPLKLYEYLSCRKPVIVSRTDGLVEVVEEGQCGLVFESGNALELAEKIVQSFNDKIALDQMGRNGRALVQDKYSWRRAAQRIMTTLQELSI